MICPTCENFLPAEVSSLEELNRPETFAQNGQSSGMTLLGRSEPGVANGERGDPAIGSGRENRCGIPSFGKGDSIFPRPIISRKMLSSQAEGRCAAMVRPLPISGSHRDSFGAPGVRQPDRGGLLKYSRASIK